MSHRLVRRVTAVACLTVLLLLSTATAAVVKLDPSQPIVGVPFLASAPSLPASRSLYLSLTDSCTAAVGGTCIMGADGPMNKDATTCIFTVTHTDVGVEVQLPGDPLPLYWCSDAKDVALLEEFHLSRIDPRPPFFRSGTNNVIRFSDVTPLTTEIHMSSTYDCATPVTGLPTYRLDASRTITVSTTGGPVMYVCARFPTVLGTETALILSAAIYNTLSYSILNTQGTRYTTASVVSTGTFTRFSLSTYDDCLPLAQEASNAVQGGTASLDIQVPRGAYYFCANQATVFVPAAEKFIVTEYAVQPNDIYTNQATYMRFALDAVQPGKTFEAALFRSDSCSDMMIDWSATPRWTVSASGSYYPCVREVGKVDTIARAGNITAINPPSVTFNRDPGIKGLGIVATVTRAGVTGQLLVGLGDLTKGAANACDHVVTSASTTSKGTTAVMHVPSTAPTLTAECISTPYDEADAASIEDRYFYPFHDFSLQAYALTHEPLIIDTILSIGLDSTVQFASSTTMKLMPADVGCTGSIGGNNNNIFSVTTGTSALYPVSFPTAGDWLLCVSEPAYFEGAFQELRRLHVYGYATVAPSGVVTGIPATVMVSGIPPLAVVFATTTASCTNVVDADRLAATTSSSEGVATLIDLLVKVEGSVILCVAYAGEANNVMSTPVMKVAATLQSAAPQVFTNIAMVNKASMLSILVPDPRLLVGGLAYFVKSGIKCTSAVPVDAQQVVIKAGLNAGDYPYCLFTPTSLDITSYNMCVGENAHYVSAGLVTVIKQLTMTPNPTPATARGMTMAATFSGDSLLTVKPTQFAVIDATRTCAVDLLTVTVYARGNLDSSYTTSLFQTPANVDSAIICVASADMLVAPSAGYLYGGTVRLVGFQAMTRYVQLGRTNDLRGTPMSPDGSLFITPCSGSTCAAASSTTTCTSAPVRYVTSALQTLEKASIGTYVLCQWSTTTAPAIVGSNNTLEVITPWVVSTTESLIRQYKPFALHIAGGPATPPAAGYTVRVQPADIPCATVAGSQQTYTGLTTGDNVITIWHVEPIQSIQFCLVFDDDDVVSVLTSTLGYYMTPAAIVAGAATKITSGMQKNNAYAKMSSDAGCVSTISSGAAQSITNYISTLTVDGCGANAKVKDVYYCESTDGGTSFALRGKMVLLRPEGCAGGEGSSIQPVTVAPAHAMTDFGLADNIFLPDPRLSRTADCMNLIDSRVTTVGYSPVISDLDPVFFVCAHPIAEPTYTFTTTAATLTVTRWSVQPTCILSRFNATMGVLPETELVINYKTPSTQTFLGFGRDCEAPKSASGLSTTKRTTVVSMTGVNGLVYVCTPDTLTSNAIPIANFLSVTPPSVVKMNPAIVRGATFRATLVVGSYGGQDPLYAMIPKSDSNFAYVSYYVTDDRSVFLSADGCQSVLATTTSTTVTTTSDNSVSFVTSEIAPAVTSVALCTGTPAGVANAVPNVPVAPGQVYPTQYVTGAASQIYIPLYPQTVFSLSFGNNDCSAVNANLPTFETDLEGYATIILHDADNQPAPIGVYTLCHSTNPPLLTAVSSRIEVVAPKHFSILGLTFLVNIPGTMVLTEDLQTSHLLPGFSTSHTCTNPSTTYGKWVASSTTSIAVTAARAADSIYLCAVAPVNNTIVAVPATPSSIEFVSSAVLVPPSDGVIDTCNGITYGTCAAPGTKAPSDSVLAVIAGDCCNPADQKKLLGSTPLNPQGACRLLLSERAVAQYPADTYHMCIFSLQDPTYCMTTGTVTPNTDCSGHMDKDSNPLQQGWVVALIVIGCILGVLLLAFLIWLIHYCCCRRIVSKEIEEYQLVALRQMECSEYEGSVGVSCPGYPVRHPLLYYPSSGSSSLEQLDSNTRSISQQGRSESSPPQTLVESIEDDERDQIALEEARTRYQMRLRFTELLERLRLEEKACDADIGYELEEEMPPVGHAVPERREVEAIDLDESTILDDEYTQPHCRDTDTDHCLVVDDTMTTEEGAQHSRHSTTERRPRHRSVESASPSTPVEHRRDLDKVHTAQDDSPSIHYASAPAAEQHEAMPRRRHTIRSSTSVSRFSTPHIDPMQPTPSTDPSLHHADRELSYPTECSAPEPARRSRSSKTSRPPASGCVKAHDRQRTVLPQPDDVEVEDELSEGDFMNLKEAYQPAPPHPQPAAPIGSAVLQPVYPLVFLPPHLETDDPMADEEDDAMSYTTTQRFFDEARFLHEQEEIRRQRLSNWEEEECACLAESELDHYMTLARASYQVNNEMTRDKKAAPRPKGPTQSIYGDQRHSLSGSDKCDGVTVDAEELHHVPERPAVLPPLPPTPNPKTNHARAHTLTAPTAAPARCRSDSNEQPASQPPSGGATAQWMRHSQQAEGVDYDEIVEL